MFGVSKVEASHDAWCDIGHPFGPWQNRCHASWICPVGKVSVHISWMVRRLTRVVPIS